MDRRRMLWIGAAVGVVLGALVVWLVWPEERPEPPRSRLYLEYTACLLTDAEGVAGAAAAPVWAGMRDASRATHAKVQFLQVTGEATVGNALPYLATLVQRRCAVVFAVGPAQVAAVAADAAKHPEVRFVVAGGSSPASNVTAIDSSDPGQVRGQADRLLRDAVRRTTR